MEMVKQLFSMYKFGIIPLKQRIKHGSLEYQYQEYIHAYIYIYTMYIDIMYNTLGHDNLLHFGFLLQVCENTTYWMNQSQNLQTWSSGQFRRYCKNYECTVSVSDMDAIIFRLSKPKNNCDINLSVITLCH